ncbi:MAG: M55 family metallopeptidase [Thermoproteota archaeon]
MKLYIMTDLEGATGVVGHWDVIDPPGLEYQASRKLLTNDVNAAIEGALEAGADEILVNDGHGESRVHGILIEEIDPRAKLLRGRRPSELEALDETFDAMFIVAAHSMAGTTNGVLSHTFSDSILNMWINDMKIGEIGFWKATAGHYDVPTVLVVGDLAATKEAKGLVPNIETVAVKEGRSRFSAICLPPDETRRSIKEAAKRALRRIGEIEPFKIKPPLVVRIEYQDALTADRESKRKGIRRIDGRTIEYEAETILQAI